MTASEIHARRLPQAGETGSVCLMDQEIEGTQVFCHVLSPGARLGLPPCENYVRVLFVCSGQAELRSITATKKFSGRGLFIGAVEDAVTVTAETDSQILELRRFLEADEFARLLRSEELPYCLDYSAAPKYTEDCKSPKTTSRMLVPQRLIPRFAMGSVETYGTDRIEKHTHPVLEQFFFGLEENDCVAMIDDLEYPFGGNTLLHIPLGSDHGIRLDEQHACHYLWMDFLLNEEALQYMDEAHQIIK